MKLQDVLALVQPIETQGSLQQEITAVCTDSRAVQKGNLFVAVKGTQADGHTFIPKALEQGATAVLVSNPIPSEIPEGVTYVRVADTEAAVGPVATHHLPSTSRYCDRSKICVSA